jgi:Zn-dependent protease
MGGIPLGRIAGFPVNANWSVLVILWLFTWSLASTLPTTAAGYPTGSYWIAGACGATVLLAHELAHAIVARRAGIQVLGVTLWIFGGVTRLGGQAKTPQTAFRIAVAGPATSLLLAAVFAGAGTPSDLTRLIDVYRLARPGVAVADGHQRGYEEGGARRIP